MRSSVITLALLLAVGCSNPRDTVLPKDLAKVESIKPTLEKLSPEEKELVAGYVVRHTVGASLGAAFGVKTDPIPDGMTIGRAIEEQRAFIARTQAEEEQRKVAREKEEAARKAMAAQMKALIGGQITEIELHKATFRDGDVQSRINFTFEFENKGQKDIAGIKGMAMFKDTFGDTVSVLPFKMEQTIPAGHTVKVRLAKDYNQFSDTDRKLTNLDVSKVSFDLTASVVLFADGTKFEAPVSPRE